MALGFSLSHPPVRPSVSRRDVIPELGIAAAAVAATTLAHYLIVLRVGDNPMFLFSATAAAITFWRGLGPGILASSLGSSIGSALYAQPFTSVSRHGGNVVLDTAMMFAASMVICWMIYKLRVDQEDAQGVQARRNEALAFVSHELRQPFANIKLAAAILARDPSEETRDRAATLMMRSAARLETMIDDLADVTRLEASAIRVEPRKVRLQDPILAAAETARPAIEQKQQVLEIDIALEPPLWVRGDAIRLEQVFGNLLSNACKYSPDSAEISISLREERGCALVVVRDTGLGIRRDMLETIFEPFVRDSTGGIDGLGIGLTLARTLVVQHGGKIAADSDGPGRGSTFEVELPLLK